MLCLSHAHLCSEHFAECDFIIFTAEYQGCLQGNRLGKNSSSNLQGWSWRAASAQHDTKNWEIHWYPETSANKAKTNSLTRMPTVEKAIKERDCTQMPVTKKERTDHKCLWQRKKEQTTNAGGKRKMASLIRQANSWHQMKETKQLKPPQNPKRLSTCKHKVERKTHHQITTV